MRATFFSSKYDSYEDTYILWEQGSLKLDLGTKLTLMLCLFLMQLKNVYRPTGNIITGPESKLMLFRKICAIASTLKYLTFEEKKID